MYPQTLGCPITVYTCGVYNNESGLFKAALRQEAGFQPRYILACDRASWYTAQERTVTPELLPDMKKGYEKIKKVLTFYGIDSIIPFVVCEAHTYAEVSELADEQD